MMNVFPFLFEIGQYLFGNERLVAAQIFGRVKKSRSIFVIQAQKFGQLLG